jgi:hypothetical protein
MVFLTSSFCAAELAASASGAIADGIQAMELEDYKRGLARSPQPTPAKRQRPAHPASNLGPNANPHQQQQQQQQQQQPQQQPVQDSSAAQPSANGSGGGSQPSDRSDGDGGPAMEVGAQHHCPHRQRWQTSQ